VLSLYITTSITPAAPHFFSRKRHDRHAQANKEYYEQVLFNPAPRTLQPDRFSTYYPYFSGGRRPLPIETVNQK